MHCLRSFLPSCLGYFLCLISHLTLRLVLRYLRRHLKRRHLKVARQLATLAPSHTFTLTLTLTLL